MQESPARLLLDICSTVFLSLQRFIIFEAVIVKFSRYNVGITDKIRKKAERQKFRCSLCRKVLCTKWDCNNHIKTIYDGNGHSMPVEESKPTPITSYFTSTQNTSRDEEPSVNQIGSHPSEITGTGIAVSADDLPVPEVSPSVSTSTNSNMTKGSN